MNHSNHPHRSYRSARPLLAAFLAGLTASLTPAAPLALAMVAGTALTAPARADAPEALPIKAITLYRSGVGSFQRAGQVSGDALINLKFNTDQINDILKSMVVLDLSGGRVESVAYGSKDPLSKRLASFGVDISDNPSLADLMKRLRGSAITVTAPEGPVSGTILGVEPRQRSDGSAQQVVTVPYLTLVTPSGLRAVDINTITSFDLQDKELAADLNKALAALADQRAERIKTVDISLRGDGTRDIAIAYIHETPVWKTSYRLVLPEGEGGKSAGDKGAMLQGWAIVENTTDQDWKEVRLSLVSGQPVSFQMDLYEPLYSARPEVPVPTIPGVAPKIYEGGIVLGQELKAADAAGRAIAGSWEAAERAKAGAYGGGGRGRAPGAPATAAPAEAADRDMARISMRESLASMGAAASGGEVGEVFQYQLSTPVSIQRQQSAMLPILSEGVQARRVSIYSRSDNPKHPARGVELTNSTDLQLLPGPITVFDSTSYAGDSQIGHITPGDHRLLAYAVDLDVDAIVEDQSNSTVNKLRIVNGMIEQTVKQVYSTSYSFTNKDGKRARTLIVEHPRMGGWDLVDGKGKLIEKTEGLYRYELGLEPSGGGKPKTAPLTIAQERTDRQYIGLIDFDSTTLLTYSKEGKVSQKVVDAFRDAAARKRAVDDAQTKVRNLETERAEIDKDQSRIRENMKTLDKGSQVYSRYLQKLDTQETRLEALAKEIEEARVTAQKMETEFQAYIAALNVE
ncbi:MAG: hypothetical protein IT436_06995 [Phycisphaerales bacterium]|nr:hypothetical protein [Phycisphaerales bacterium]